MIMATGRWMCGCGAILPVEDALRGSTEAVVDAERTLARGRARSKSGARISDGGHEVSKVAK